MLVPRLVEIAVLFLVGAYLMLVVLRFVRGTPPPRDDGDDAPAAPRTVWQTLGPVLFFLAAYLVVTRLLRL